MESENHENRRETLTWYVESMEKFWKCLEQVVVQHGWNPEISTCDKEISHAEISGFQPSCGITCFKHFQNFFIVSTCDVKASRPFSWFSDFVRILYIFKSNLTQLGRHVACTRWWSFRVCPWIWHRNTLGRMNISYWIAEIHYFIHLQFKCASCGKNQENEKTHEI
jgi:hypothetical protein